LISNFEFFSDFVVPVHTSNPDAERDGNNILIVDLSCRDTHPLGQSHVAAQRLASVFLRKPAGAEINIRIC
jgi:hypothetical protein